MRTQKAEHGVIGQNIPLPFGRISFSYTIYEMRFGPEDIVSLFIVAIILIVNYEFINISGVKWVWTGIPVSEPKPHHSVRHVPYAFLVDKYLYCVRLTFRNRSPLHFTCIPKMLRGSACG